MLLLIRFHTLSSLFIILNSLAFLAPAFGQASPAAQGRLLVQVTDSDSRKPIPCKITLLNALGMLPVVTAEPGQKLAVRPGVVYTGNGRAEIKLPAGIYTIFASRGFEFGVDRRTVRIEPGSSESASLKIRREVDTSGFISCDTHVHTFTYSRHGDASLEERALTLAGEGIELPIATDHDYLTDDLGSAAERMGVRAELTPVVGCEVTTRVGHFNAFPFDPSQKAPSNRSTSWPEIIAGIRSTPSQPFIILNHPRDKHGDFRPFDPTHFNAVVGEHQRGPLGVDAIEVINSGAMQSDPMVPIRDWMALLNHGERLTAVGASDSHDVARHIVGQGRTYIRCPDTVSSQIDVRTAVNALRQGKASVSLGLLANISVNDRFSSGDLATGLGDRVQVRVAISGPSWTAVDRVELYANGVLIDQVDLKILNQTGLKHVYTKEIMQPRADSHLIAVASGPGVTEAFWPIEHPYQPTTPNYSPRVWALVNPVFLDGDGDGQWTSPHAAAHALINRFGTNPAALLPALSTYDQATAEQTADLCRLSGADLNSDAFSRAINDAAQPVRAGFTRYLKSIAPQK